MPEIKPFRAIFYNQRLVSDLSKVICPPYDVITPEERKRYYRLHSYNMINLILSKRKAKLNKYTNAKRIFLDWLKRGILKKDKTNCLYLYEQNYLASPFYSEGKPEKKKRVGFFGLLNLNNKEIFCHEQTREEPKTDRLLLLKAVKANLCPIFVLFSNKKKILNSLYKIFSKRAPFIDIQDREISHRLWRIDEDSYIEKLKQSFKDTPLFIADGHHRYETACAYRDLKRKGLKNFTGEEDFNYILAYFTNLESEGLSVFAVHRATKKNVDVLEDYFEIKETSRFKLFNSMKQHIIGMYKDKKFFSLYLKRKDLLDKIDVQILDFLFKESNLKEEDIIYSHQVDKIIEAVDRKSAKMGFFLNPLKIEEIVNISLKKERLPRKSTYFYPKLPSGLLIHKFKEG